MNKTDVISFMSGRLLVAVGGLCPTLEPDSSSESSTTSTIILWPAAQLAVLQVVDCR